MNKSNIIACDLTTLTTEERDRLMKNAKEIFGKVHEICELPDGYAMSFKDKSAHMLSQLADFIIYDRLCCPFIRYGFVVEPFDGFIWLQLTGGDGVKAFIRADLLSLLPEETTVAKSLGEPQKERN